MNWGWLPGTDHETKHEPDVVQSARELVANRRQGLLGCLEHGMLLEGVDDEVFVAFAAELVLGAIFGNGHCVMILTTELGFSSNQ